MDSNLLSPVLPPHSGATTTPPPSILPPKLWATDPDIPDVDRLAIAVDLLRRIEVDQFRFDDRGRLHLHTAEHGRWFRAARCKNYYCWLTNCGSLVRDLGRLVGQRKLAGDLRRVVSVLLATRQNERGAGR